MEFVFVDTVDEVLDEALERGRLAEAPPKPPSGRGRRRAGPVAASSGVPRLSPGRVPGKRTLEESYGSKKKAAKAGAGAFAAGQAARNNPYVQRLVEDEELRDNLRTAYESARKAYARMQRQGPGRRRSRTRRCRRSSRRRRLAARRGRRPARAQAQEAPRAAGCCSSGLVGAGLALAPQRGPAQEGARRAVRSRGGVRVHLDHHPGPVAAPRASRSGSLARPVRAPRLVEEAPPGAPLSFARGRLPLAGRPARMPRRGSVRRGTAQARRARRRSASSPRCARASPRAAPRARPSTSWRARPASPAGCSTTTSARRSGCWSRSCAATATRASPRSRQRARRGPASVDEIVGTLVASLEAFVEDEPGTQAVLYEMVSASRHSEEIRAELAELYRRWRGHLAEALREKEREGVVKLDADAGGGRVDPLRARRRARPAADLRPGLGERGLARGRHGRGAAPARGGG